MFTTGLMHFFVLSLFTSVFVIMIKKFQPRDTCRHLDRLANLVTTTTNPHRPIIHSRPSSINSVTPSLGVCHSFILCVLSSHLLWILNSRVRGSHLHPTTNNPYPDDLFIGHISAKMSNNKISPRSRKTKQCLANTNTLTSNTTTDKTKSAIFVQTDQRLHTTTVECITRI